MGLMDSLKDEASNHVGVQNENLAQSVLGTFQSQGGLSGLVTTFHEKGLGGVISSWIGTGSNEPINAAQIESVLGKDRISSIASKFGVPATAVPETLAQFLPGVIDRMTPDGKLSH